jgi:hypothetical protein
MNEDGGVVAAHVGVRDAALRFAQFFKTFMQRMRNIGLASSFA